MKEEKYENIIVIAGNHEQFVNFIKRLPSGDKNNYICAEFISKIAGIRANRIIEIGTYYERNDYEKVKQLAESRLFYSPLQLITNLK